MKRTLLAAVSVGILLLIVTSPVTAIWLIKRQATKIVTDSMHGLTTSSLATMNVSEGFIQTALLVNGGDESTTEEQLKTLEETTREVDAQYEAHRATLGSQSERREFDRLLACRDAYRATRKKIIGLLGEGKRPEAQMLFRDECVRNYHTYTEALGNLIGQNVLSARSGGREIVRLCFILLAVQVLLLAFFFIYGFFVPFTAILERLTRRPIEIRP